MLENILKNIKKCVSSCFKPYPKTTKHVTSEDLFKQDKDNDALKPSLCESCELKNSCVLLNSSYMCKYATRLPYYDKNKKSIIIVDDNEGVISFILDDLNYLQDKFGFDLSQYNILTFGTQYGVFKLKATLDVYGIDNVEFGIFDITLGGGVFDSTSGNVVLDGVDAFEMCYKLHQKGNNDKFKFLFFTGNKLNPYIKKNEETINKFNTITNGLNINDYVLYKTSKTMDSRRNYLKRFFGI